MKCWRNTLTAACVAATAVLAACGNDPIAGDETFNLLSPRQEAAIGREQHPAVVEAFGGPYQDVAVQRYVDAIGQRLVRATETPGQPFTFTVLNTDVPNAMALPGGYVYVTRGLLALANSEAELASVLAHEIGHVTARHTAERVSQSVAANLGIAILSAATGNPDLMNVAQLGAEALLKRYSRGQEYEADRLGIRYMAQAGYDPRAAATFLETLRRHAELEARSEGRSPELEDLFGIMSTHPRTQERVRQAMQAAVGVPTEGWMGREEYLQRIDGLLYGDAPSEGIVRGRDFIHPTLGFAFTVPEGFTIINTDEAVVAGHPSGAVIIFDGGQARGSADPAAYLARHWAGDRPISGLERISIDGLPAATGATRLTTGRGPMDVRLVAIRFDPDTVYRFIFATPPRVTDRLNRELRATTYSFRALSPAEAASINPYRLRTVRVRPGDTVESLAATMPFPDGKVERFRALNGLAPGEELRPGQLVKVVI